MKHERNVIAVDFDGVICNGKYWLGEEVIPNNKVIEWVNKKYLEGSVIIIHTARRWEMARETIALLTKYGVYYHGVNFEKMGADCYLDDLALNVEDIK